MQKFSAFVFPKTQPLVLIISMGSVFQAKRSLISKHIRPL